MSLRSTLSELEKRNRSISFFREFALFASGTLFLGLFLFVFDNLTSFSPVFRKGTVCLWGLASLGWILFRMKRYLHPGSSLRERAMQLEKIGGIRDNLFVNAVCFQESETVSGWIREYFSKRADEKAGTIPLPSVFHDPSCRRRGGFLGGAVLLFLLYGLLFGAFAKNAFLRFLHPDSDRASLNFISFRVEPGSCTVPAGADVKIRASATLLGRPVRGLKLLAESGKEGILYPMENGEFTLHAVEKECFYTVKTDGESGKRYRIRVIPCPAVKGVSVKITPPEYTGGKPMLHREIPSVWNAEVLSGSRMEVLSDISGILAPGNKPLPWKGTVRDKTDLILSFRDSKTGLLFPRAVTLSVLGKRDEKPSVRLLNGKLNLASSPGEEIPVSVTASDDAGLKGVTLTVWTDDRPVVVKRYLFTAPGPKKIRETFFLRITKALLPENGSFTLRVTAEDRLGQKTESENFLSVHYRDLRKELKETLSSRNAGKCYELLFRAQTLQTAVRQRCTSRIRYFYSGDRNYLKNSQKQVENWIVQAEKEGTLVKMKPVWRKALADLTASARNLSRSVSDFSKPFTQVRLNNVILDQTALLKKLRTFLGAAALAEHLQDEKAAAQKEQAEEKELFNALSGLKEDLKKVREKQKKIVDSTSAFDPKKTDDWSEGEEKLLGDLGAVEEDLARFVKDKFSDFSKLQNQDFSNSAMADELVEIYEELQKAGAALKMKKVEIAVIAEANAFDFTENTLQNLERWLSDKKDYVKWQAEEDGKSQDTNLTDLPAELQDIIGDLIESEEDMTDDTSDGTNSSVWDSDLALGWGVSDGTIDSMQAKGITGNVLPNNNEVGGRSGEGRSGRSSGQFVEKDATGKGGRKTPTRLQQSPFEKGTVNDTSRDASGGASGGGKQSGAGDEGLAGVTPDQDQKTGIRLNPMQAELKQKTMAALKRLEARSLPTADLREALTLLEKLERGGSADGVEARRIRKETSAALRRAARSVSASVRAERETSRRTGKRDLQPVRVGTREKVPPAYAGEVGEYFKAIAAGGE